MLFLCLTSSLMMRPWLGIPRLGWVQLECRDRNRQHLSLIGAGGVWPRLVPTPGGGKDQFPASGRVPSSRRDQPRTAERRPAGEGLEHPYHRTAHREEDLNTPTRWTGPGTESCVKSAWSGPRCLRRATSNPQRQHSLLGTLGRANHPYGLPGQQGIVPPGFLWRETLEKPDNYSIVAHSKPAA